MADDVGEHLPLFDADNHYYEARDAFTRHLPPRMAERTVMEVTVNGRVRHLIGGKLNHAVTNPTFDPVSKPGALYAYFRGNPDGKGLRELLSDAEPIRPEYREPAARLAAMDAQQIDAGMALPHPRRDVRGSAQTRPRSGRRRFSGLQPLARRGLGSPLRRSDPGGSLHFARRRALGRG